MPDKNKFLAAILGLFLGPFGYLYVGRIKRFIVALFFSIIFIGSMSEVMSLPYIIVILFCAFDCYFIVSDSEKRKMKKVKEIENIQKIKGVEIKNIFCPNCGTKNKKDANFCSKCGKGI
jgi:predicted membrane protein